MASHGLRAVLSAKYRHLDGFVFIHINKTAGTSIKKALWIPFEHKTALEKIEELGRERWDSRRTFTAVRNPWDKVVSNYHYRVKTNQTGLGTNTIPFPEWVKRTYGEQDPFYLDQHKMFMPQVDWISDENGEIIVDEIVHFENLAPEFNAVMQKLGKKVTLPHINKTNRKNYQDYYDDESIEVIRQWFQRDIDTFGYTF